VGVRAVIKREFAALEAAAGPWADGGPWRRRAFEFLLFGLKQAFACLFGGLMIFLLVSTHLLWPDTAPLARYDFLFLASLTIQVGLLALKLEHWDEAAVILIFHVVGTIMELFKTTQGSWVYPEEAFFRIGGVPLFSGFMYACVGSYIARALRIFDIRFEHYPPVWTTWILAIGAYANFFTHHYVTDIRLVLFGFSAVIFFRAQILFTPRNRVRRMPMLVGFILVALFLWFAENAGTFANAWVYPSQRNGWTLVPIEKMGAWYLLMMLSFVLVTAVRPPRRAESLHI